MDISFQKEHVLTIKEIEKGSGLINQIKGILDTVREVALFGNLKVQT